MKVTFNNILKNIAPAFLFSLFGLAGIFTYIFLMSRDLPSLDQLENYDPDLVTRIYSSDGEILDELYLEKRIFTSLDQIPINVQNAAIASEDRRFYSHWGIDSRSILRAVIVNIIKIFNINFFK